MSGAAFPFWATTEGVEHDEIKVPMATQRAIPHPGAGGRTSCRCSSAPPS
ncbi:MAG: hypothetical protein R3C69_16650 [Geminicoccaceae bacterium]